MSTTGTRTELHEVLCGLLGNRRAYYQPPESIRLSYPCIVYSEKIPSILHADNRPYKTDRCYKITLISGDPDEPLRFNLEQLPMIRMLTEPYTSDNLHHFVYQLYY